MSLSLLSRLEPKRKQKRVQHECWNHILWLSYLLRYVLSYGLLDHDPNGLTWLDRDSHFIRTRSLIWRKENHSWSVRRFCMSEVRKLARRWKNIFCALHHINVTRFLALSAYSIPSRLFILALPASHLHKTHKYV